MKATKRFLITAVAAAGLSTVANATLLTVPGTSDPWLANTAPGTTDRTDGAPTGGEAADVNGPSGQQPVYAGAFVPGDIIAWSATGTVGHPGDDSGPDGAPGILTTRDNGAQNGVSDLPVPVQINALIGVWATAGGGGISFLMGASGTAVAPANTIGLYLGTMDGFGWANNSGWFEVNVAAVPESETGIALGIGGVAIAALAVGRRRPSLG